MEVPAGHQNKITVLLFEFFGTCMLVYAILASVGNAYAVAGTLFLLIMISGPISGAHFNPAVTLAVYIWNRKYGHDFVFFVLICAFSIAGGFLGIGLAWFTLQPRGITDSATIPVAWIAELCPNGVNALDMPTYSCDTNLDRTWSAFVM